MSNSISRRQFLKTAIAAGAGLTLAQYLPALAQEDLAGSINYIHHFTSETEFKGMERVLALFAERYPNLEVIQENIPNADYMAKFTASVVSRRISGLEDELGVSLFERRSSGVRSPSASPSQRCASPRYPAVGLSSGRRPLQ